MKNTEIFHDISKTKKSPLEQTDSFLYIQKMNTKYKRLFFSSGFLISGSCIFYALSNRSAQADKSRNC